MSHGLPRRAFLPLAGAGLFSSCSSTPPVPASPSGNAAVAVIKAASYTQDLADAIRRGVIACGLQVRGKRVLLKPNLVEFDRLAPINTDVAVVAAAMEVFTQLGAAQVLVGEGPGHRRDTWDIARETGYHQLERFAERFVDLNRDDVSAVTGFADEPRIFLPNSALGADLIVSMAKMKTHHWAGATLAMKNLFGLVPGAVYGWPKNFLHYVGIERSIVELNRIFRRTFAIVDGVVGMEGNGPIQGTAKPAGLLVMGSDLVAVDATCCRLMGLQPERVPYLTEARSLGQMDEQRIEQRGESLASVRTRFQVLGKFKDWQL